MSLPDFLVIGAAKSGTVSLYNYLKQHPQIFMSPTNETNFFALETMEMAAHFQGPHDREAVKDVCVTTLADYEWLFAEAPKQQRIGEASPLYLYSALAPGRIKHYIPHARLIVMLRQPAERAFSNYQHYRRVGFEPAQTFQEALKAEPERIAAGWGPWPFWHYVQMGFYAEQLARYFALFERQQILVCLYDDFQADSVQVMKKMYRFLGVQADFVPNTAVRHNMGGQPRQQWLFAMMTRPNWAKSLFNAFIPGVWRQRLRDTIHARNVVKAVLETEVRLALNEVYRQDIARLEGLIGRDLGHWLV
jgi:hypothetical protein